MTVHYEDESVTLHHGDCLDVLRNLPDASVDAVVTDPPYGLVFMGKKWDDHVDSAQFGRWCLSWATECLRVLKPGGHLLAFGGTRTWHRLACAVEDAGFEVRDSIAWLYGSGFPKSLDVSKAIDKAAGAEREVTGPNPYAARRTSGDFGILNDGGWQPRPTTMTAPATSDAKRWQGWGTALKPAFEPIVVARKPLAGTVAGNVLAHGTGALNIDGCRVGSGDSDDQQRPRQMGSTRQVYGAYPGGISVPAAGRWPANVVLDDTQAAELDRQSGTLTSGANPTRRGSDKLREAYGDFKGQEECIPARGADSGGASRFFPTFRGPVDDARRCMLSLCESTSASTAEGLSRTTPATPGDSVLADATTSSAVSNARAASSAASLCGSCATAIALSLVQAEPARMTQTLGLPSTGDFSERILTRSLALIAADLASSGTTWTTAEWTTSLGCAAAAISAYTTRASRPRARRSAPPDLGSELPTFKYEAKAPTHQRPRIQRADGTWEAHATVKPLDLMRWLVRLVTPPGGVVLEPFAGSGTTAEAAVLEGFSCIAIEREADYLPLIVQRLSKPLQVGLFGEEIA